MRWPTAAGGCRSTREPASIPSYLKLLLAYEDRRFYSHHGVDPQALAAPRCNSSTSGRIVSGGSTITMQVARLMEPRRERSVYAKLRQMVRAVQLERQLSKDEILDLYLTLAPFGGNLEGVRAASIAYFGKEPKRLSLAEVGAAGGVAAVAGNAAGSIVIPMSRGPRATACSIAWSRMARVPHEDAVQAKAVAVPRLRKSMPISGAAFRRPGARHARRIRR